MSYHQSPPPIPPHPSSTYNFTVPISVSTPPAPPPKAPVHSSRPYNTGASSPQTGRPPVPPPLPQGYQKQQHYELPAGNLSSPPGSGGQEQTSSHQDLRHATGAGSQYEYGGYGSSPPPHDQTQVQSGAYQTSSPPPPQGYHQQQQYEQYNIQPQSQSYSPASYDQQSSQYQQQQQQHLHQHQNPYSAHLPPIEEGWLPPSLSLPQKTKQDLSHLLSNPDLLTSILHDPSTTHESLPASTSLLQSQLARNLSLAQTLSNLSSQLSDQRSATSSHLLRVRALESRWRKKQSDLEERLAPFGARGLHARLVREINEGEMLCSSLEDSFSEDFVSSEAGNAGGESAGRSGNANGVRSEREVNEWVRRVRESRRILHLRKERKGRWDEGRVGGWR